MADAPMTDARAECLAWETHNPGDLNPDRLNVICSGADVVILSNIEADVARLIVSEHNATRARIAPAMDAEPVAWLCEDQIFEGEYHFERTPERAAYYESEGDDWKVTPLYAHPATRDLASGQQVRAEIEALPVYHAEMFEGCQVDTICRDDVLEVLTLDGKVLEAAHRILELYDDAMRDLLDPGAHDSHPDSDEMADLRRAVGAPAHRWTPAALAPAPDAAQTEDRSADIAECAAFSAGYEAGERDGRKSAPAPHPVLDVCCGSRMFWFDRHDSRVLFSDIRAETHSLPDKSSSGGYRHLIIAPDVVADFRALPFEDNAFPLVVFDPPHLAGNGKTGWLAKKYGKLGDCWRDDLRAGFAECFRVLRPYGTLIFKWNEHEIRVSEILALTDHTPLFGNRCGKTAKSHWIVFMKPEGEV